MKPHIQKSQIPIILIVLGAFLLIAVILVAFQNASNTSTAEPHSDEETYPEIQRVSLTNAKATLDAGSAIFVDVRSAQAYQESHIAGSVNIPLVELEQRFSELDPADWIVTYCT